jgi:hypothetical protein
MASIRKYIDAKRKHFCTTDDDCNCETVSYKFKDGSKRLRHEDESSFRFYDTHSCLTDHCAMPHRQFTSTKDDK